MPLLVQEACQGKNNHKREDVSGGVPSGIIFSKAFTLPFMINHTLPCFRIISQSQW